LQVYSRCIHWKQINLIDVHQKFVVETAALNSAAGALGW
jgi:hypothetical protein